MIKRSKPLLADTVVVIDAHENDYWEPLCNVHDVALPAIVIENELFHFESGKGKQGLKPSLWVKEGKIVSLNAELKDYETIRQKLSEDFFASLHAGELEALAILLSKHHQDRFFTTADRAAIKALGVLGLSHRGVSVEELLNGLGGRSKKRAKLPPHLTKQWFQKALTEGFSERHLWLR